MLEGEVRALSFQELETLHEVLVCPLFLLELSNSASYQKLAFDSLAQDFQATLLDCSGRAILLQSPLHRGKAGAIVQG